MSRLICVSNRVSLPDPVTGEIRAGGLAVGVEAALKHMGGGLWFGWSGDVVTAIRADGRPVHRTNGANKISFATIPLSEDEFAGYYESVSNEVLWPMMHELAGHVDGAGADFETYYRVNRIFAQELIKHIRPGDRIWVHDYHLLPLGQALREAGVGRGDVSLLYYNHIPVPSKNFIDNHVRGPLKDEFLTLMKGLDAYDQVGFQTTRDLGNYLDLRGEPAARFERFKARAAVKGSAARFGFFPISIDTREVEKTARDSSKDERVTQMRRQLSVGNKRLVVGAERLDYTKGLAERLDGISLFLEQNPQAHEMVQFLQITPLSRESIDEYKDEARRIEDKKSLVNTSFATDLWTPVRFTENMIERERLLGIFRLARVGIVTSLMDGQNLVAKEYLAAQDPKDPGILILSRYAGASEELEKGGALLIDPENPQEIAEALTKALDMDLAERKEFHQQALMLLRQNDVNNWVRSFLDEASAPAMHMTARKAACAS